MMESIDAHCIHAGDEVLIKPNLLLPAAPQKGILTHPLVVKAVVEYVLEKGGRPKIADSPAMGHIHRIYHEGGYARALAGLDVPFSVFQETVPVDIGAPFGRIEIAREAMETDAIINLPKLKTHAMMLLTLGVKNLFGCIVGMEKPEWHFRVGIDKTLFARLLVRISEAVKPSMTLLDGILALEGQGPGKGGTPRHVGLLIGSRQAPAIERAVCQMFGLPPHHLPILKELMQSGIWHEPLELHGDYVEVKGFQLPVQGPATLGPTFFQGFARQYLLARPEVDPDLCRMCGKCEAYCPAGAVTRQANHLHFDYERCIRCYCCVEVCPYGALRSKEPPAGKVYRLLRHFIERIKSGASAGA
jgi:uncharacterized protein (DUF362 family)/Pyruvate/2-oxoacid:ferredoxin oxidoreductase delta subunit